MQTTEDRMLAALRSWKAFRLLVIASLPFCGSGRARRSTYPRWRLPIWRRVWPVTPTEREADLSEKQSPRRWMLYDQRLSKDLVERLWRDPDSLFLPRRVLSDRPRSLVSLVDLEWNPAAHERQSSQANDNGAVFSVANQGVFKQHRLAGWLHTLGHLFVHTRGFRTWVYGREILAAGIPTPRPLAMIEERWGPLRFRSFVLTEFVIGTHLDDFVQENSLLPPQLDWLADRFLAIWHQLGDLHLSHGDLHPGNFLVTSDWRLHLIDLDHMGRHWFRHRFIRQRNKDWFQFVRPRPQHRSDAWQEFLATVTRRESKMVVTSPEDHS
ncbi:MAG: hypothetical protein FJ256_06125 [Phycisphaerae bacterium]|nr:hypothetical protein [Phycisphaerae bacterium]